MATPDQMPPQGGTAGAPQGGAQPPMDQGGNQDPNAQGGGGQIAAQVVVRFYKEGFVTLSAAGEDEEPVQSLEDIVGVIASLAQAHLPGGGGEMGGEGGEPAQGGAPQGGAPAPEEEEEDSFGKGFKRGKGM